MGIPKNITKEHIEKAIIEIQNAEIPSQRLSKEYLLKVGDKELPPKYVISIANKYVNNEILESEDFSASEAKRYLENLKYIVIKKIDKSLEYYQELKKFIKQTKTSDLKTSYYQKVYSNLKVKVGLGQGNQAGIPWIAFLKDGEKVQNGIYPVYLFYKKLNLLILSYGISVKNMPVNSWNLKNEKTITEYFVERGLMPPKKKEYGSSFVFAEYNINPTVNLNEEIINSDLNELIEIYKNLNSQTIVEPKPIKNIFDCNLLNQSIINAGLNIDKFIVGRFISSLITKPFVILTGLSGSGKTKLAQVFVKWICENESQYKLIPVGADWTNREPLLGYPNALEPGKYVLPENGVLSLIIEAQKEKNQDKPYFIILDEMNLSHVERYFADFLSAMESGEDIPLHPDSEDWKDDVPSKLKLPKNLFIVGTVNIDETTYMFSPKVLDRANVIEFRVSRDEMEQFLGNIQPLKMESIQGLGANMAESFVKMANDKSLKTVQYEVLNATLLKFFNELKKTGAEFGYRSATEIHRFVAVANQLNPKWEMNEIIDCAIMQKLLPKVHGSRRKLETFMKTMALLCLAYEEKIENIFDQKHEIDFIDPTKCKYPISFEKISRMYKKMIENGFTSYAEA